jgi:hypothetical protein
MFHLVLILLAVPSKLAVIKKFVGDVKVRGSGSISAKLVAGSGGG